MTSAAAQGRGFYANNNFDLIRLIAATQVVVMHSVAHLRVASLDRFAAIVDYFPGVPAFFFISGFLIKAAWERNPDVRVFYTNRAYRILPALWASVGVATITLLIFFDRATIAAHSGQLFAWMIGQATIGQVWTPAFLRSYGVGVVNGSLWTIPVELSFYAVLPLLARMSARSARPTLALFPLIVASFAINYSIVLWTPTNARYILAQKLLMTSPIPWFGMFFIGMLAQENIDRLYAMVAGRVWIFLLAFIAVAMFSHFLPIYPWLSGPDQVIGGGNRIGVANYLALCALVLSAAYSYRTLSDRVLARNDLSYGTYIAHMIVINVAVQLGVFGFTGLGIVIPIVAAIAAASWFFLEKPMLSRRKASLYQR